jgi:hypothetical protein
VKYLELSEVHIGLFIPHLRSRGRRRLLVLLVLLVLGLLLLGLVLLLVRIRLLLLLVLRSLLLLGLSNMYIGVVSVFIQYNCVYYCDTRRNRPRQY